MTNCACGECVPCILAKELSEYDQATQENSQEAQRTARISKRVADEWDAATRSSAVKTQKIPKAIIHTGVHQLALVGAGGKE